MHDQRISPVCMLLVGSSVKKNPGTDAGKYEWLIRSVFKEDYVHGFNRQ